MTAGAIVVGVDGSAPSSQALRWAAEQATLEARPLRVLHATGAPWGDADGLDGVSAAVVRAGTEVLDAAVADAQRWFPGLDVQTSLVHVDARLALFKAAEHSRLLVVGSRGRGPVARLVLGSVSAAAARHSPCPVVVVRPQTPDVVRRGVLVGVDADDRSHDAVEFAFRLASVRGLPLTVMHCFLDLTETVAGPSQVPHDTPGFEDRRRVLDEVVRETRAKFPDVPLDLVIGRGLVEDCLVNAAEQMDAVVVGTHHSSFVTTLFDRHTDRSLVTRAASVVVVVPEAGPHHG